MGKELNDYVMFWDKINSWNDKKLKDSIDEYEKEFDRLKPIRDDMHNKLNILFENVKEFKRIQHERYLEKLEKNFKLTKEHIKLLQGMEFKNYPEGGDYVFLGVEGKRPFGNSDYYGDAAEILGMKKDKNGELKERDIKYIEKIFDELPIAINYIMENAIKLLR